MHNSKTAKSLKSSSGEKSEKTHLTLFWRDGEGKNSRAEEKPFCCLESRTPVQSGKHPAEIKPYIPLLNQIDFEMILEFPSLNQ